MLIEFIGKGEFTGRMYAWNKKKPRKINLEITRNPRNHMKPFLIKIKSANKIRK